MCAHRHWLLLLGLVVGQGISEVRTMELGQNVLWFEDGITSYFVQPPPDFNTTNDPWKPAVVSDLKPFRKGALRMMDAGMTNRNNVSTWMDRRQKGEAHQTPDWSPQGSKGMAYEWMILLCNKVGINCWVNVPCRTVSAADGFALPDYALRMALLIKTGVDMHTVDLKPLVSKLSTMDAAALVTAGGRRTGVALDPSLRLHVELGNEMWWEPECKNYSTTQGKVMGLPNMNGNLHNSWYAFGQLQVIRAFEAVFGHESETLYRQFSGQAGNTWLVGNGNPHMHVLDSPTYNPDNIKLEGYAIAPYLKDPATSPVAKSLAEVVESCAAFHKTLAPRNIELIAYEGGLGEVDKTLPSIGEDYTKYWSAMSTVINGTFCNYGYASAGSGKDGKGNWGIKPYPGAPPNAGWTATQAWAEAHN
jgi:hypothetical protein